MNIQVPGMRVPVVHTGELVRVYLATWYTTAVHRNSLILADGHRQRPFDLLVGALTVLISLVDLCGILALVHRK